MDLLRRSYLDRLLPRLLISQFTLCFELLIDRLLLLFCDSLGLQFSVSFSSLCLCNFTVNLPLFKVSLFLLLIKLSLNLSSILLKLFLSLLSLFLCKSIICLLDLIRGEDQRLTLLFITHLLKETFASGALVLLLNNSTPKVVVLMLKKLILSCQGLYCVN